MIRTDKKEGCKLSASSPIGKRKSDNYVIYIICLVVVLYLALHSAICWETTLQMVSSGQIIEKDKLFTFIQLLTERLNSNPMDIQTNAYTVKFLLSSALGWFVVCAAIEDNKKNYISGKEFGTAEWGTKNDIVDLFADTIKQQELKKAKKMKGIVVKLKKGIPFFISMTLFLIEIIAVILFTGLAKQKASKYGIGSIFFLLLLSQNHIAKFILSKIRIMNMRKKELKLTQKYYQNERKRKLETLKSREEDEEQERKDREKQLKASTNPLAVEELKKLQNEQKDVKKTHKKREEEILQELKEEKIRMEGQAWKPDLLKEERKETLKKIEEEVNKNLLESDEAKERRNEVNRKYEYSLVEYYDVKKRVKQVEEKYKNADILFTATEKISFYNYVLNLNTMILGGSGSGKSRGYVLPNLLQAFCSYVVTDPKGEVLEKCGKFLKSNGYKIKVLNLDNKAESDYYNPFQYIHPERAGYEERILSLIETIIANTDGGESKQSNDPFWDRAERLFLQSIFYFTVDCFEEKDRNMNTVNKLIKWLEIDEENDEKNSKLDQFVEMMKAELGKDHIGIDMYEEFRSKASGKTAKSIVITAVARLAPFKTQEVRRIFSHDTMELDRIGEEKVALFVNVPPTDKTYNFISGMLFTQLFQEIQYCATQVHKHDGQRLPIPVRFILDEFANTCTIPNFVQILAYARSFGVGITVILQSLEQIKKMYKDDWGVIIDNCNTLLYLGAITHDATLEYIVKLIGKGTFDKRTTGRTRGRQGSSSQNFDKVGRELMDISEVRKLPKSDCLLFVGGRNPFYSKKFDYTTHPNYCYTSDANREFTYQHEPQKPIMESEKKLEEMMKNTLREEAQKEVQRLMQDVELIELVISPEQMLNRIGRGNFDVIPDEELIVPDGEENTIEDDTLREVEDELVTKEESETNVQEPTEETSVCELIEDTNQQAELMKQTFQNGVELMSDEEVEPSEGEADTIDEESLAMMQELYEEDEDFMESDFDFEEEMDMDKEISQLKNSGQMPEDEIKSPEEK